jgi:hypothetical protein
MTDLDGAAQEFRDLAIVLQQVGLDGLRRELYKAVSDAAGPLADRVKDPSHLQEYMPNRYADVLAASLKVTTSKRTGTDPGVFIVARAPTGGRGGRRVRQRNEGILGHPVFGRRMKLNPRMWAGWVYQSKGMHPGFFDDPLERGAPLVREQILAAMRRVAEEATRRP